MKFKPFRIFFYIILIAITYCSDAKSDDNHTQSITHKVIYDVESVIQNKSLTKSQKINKLTEILKVAKDYLTQDEFLEIFRKSEPLLLSESEDPLDSYYQVLFLLNQFTNPYWVYSENREKIIDRILFLEKSALQKIHKKDKNLTIAFRSFVDLFLANELSYQQRYAEADIKFDDFEQNIKLVNMPSDISFTLRYVIRGIKVKSMIARGNIKKARELSEILDHDFDKVLFYFKKDSKFKNSLNGLIITATQVDFFLGKYDSAILKAEKILSQFPIENNFQNLSLSQDQFILMRTLSEAYKLKGNEEKSSFYSKAASKIYHETTMDELFQEYFHTMFVGEYHKAKELVQKIHKFYQKAYPFSSESEKRLFSKVITEMNSFTDSEIKISKLPYSECMSDLCIKNRTEIMEIENNAKKNNNLDAWKDLLEAHYKMTKQLEELDHHQQSLSRAEAFMTNFAPIMEEIYLFGMENEQLDLPAQLVQLSVLHDFYSFSNKKYAAFFARSYIEKFQNLRSQLKGIYSKDLTSLTEKHIDEIKRFSTTFFDIGDTENALLCLRVIKQNEYLDYLNPRNTSEIYLEKISKPNIETDYDIQLARLLSEIKYLKNSKQRSRDEAETIKFQEAIQNKKNEIINLRDIYKTKISDYEFQDKLALKTTANLKKNEAQLQLFLTDKSIQAYLTTQKGTSHYEANIARKDISKMILDLNLSLSKKTQLPANALDEISKALIEKPFSDLALRGEIDTVKIISDSYLNLIPLNILTFNNEPIGDKYIISFMGVGESKSYEDTSNFNFDAFGASKGSAEFSPLPGVADEIRELMSIPLSKKKYRRTAFLDKDFTEKTLISSLRKNPSLVHIASHFKIQGNSAITSKLLLGNGFVISLDELKKKLPKFNSNLITLSACQTADLIPSVRGLSFDGLSNTFQTSGAQNVLASSWEIDDKATAVFMDIFYNLLLNNDITPSQALFYTQKVFRNGSSALLPKQIIFTNFSNKKILGLLKDYQHPYYWSGFRITSLE